MNKSSTVKMSGNEILKQQKLTVGMDLGDRSTRYCVLDEAGDVILERSVPTTKKGMDQVFAAMPRSRVTLETGAHSPLGQPAVDATRTRSDRGPNTAG